MGPSLVNPERAELPTQLLDQVRRCCRGLHGVIEEPAWRGTRWVVNGRTFAHLIPIFEGKPAAYARAARHDGPVVVLTLRAAAADQRARVAEGPPYFHAPWGTKWGAQVLGLTLGPRTRWREVKTLIAQSHRLMSLARRG